MKNTIDIKNLDFSELKVLLKELKLLNYLDKQLWNRGRLLFNKIKTGTHSYEVEYFPVIWKDLAFSEAKKVYKEIFNLDVKEDEITFVEKDNLKWGIRVYLDDKIVDLSYDKIEKTLTK